MLGRFEDEIKHLFGICANNDEAEILLHTLSQMSILDHDQLSFGLKAMARHAAAKIEDSGTLAIVAMAYDSSADGSQLILQMLKTELDRNLKIKLFNTIPNYLRKMEEYPHFMLIDDFSGTGGTVLNRLRHIDKNAQSRQISITRSVCLIAAMQAAKLAIESEGYEVKVFKELKAGLSGHFSGDTLDQARRQMLRLESELNPNISGKALPSFGHGGAEALYFVHPGNAPNSNFPIFWWPEDKTGNPRKTMMRRHEL